MVVQNGGLPWQKVKQHLKQIQVNIPYMEHMGITTVDGGNPAPPRMYKTL